MILPVNKRIFGITLRICVVLGLICNSMEQNNKQMQFNVSGIMAEALTPLNDDNSVNITAILDYVDFLVDMGVKSVLVGGSSGDHTTLSVRDRKRIIKEWVNSARGKDLHVQAQVGGAPFPDVIDLVAYCYELEAKYSALIGVDSILTLPDLYLRASTPDELVSYVERVAKAAPNKPVLYYHYPKKTQVNVKMPEFVASATARIANFMGIQFTSFDLVEALEVLDILRPPQKIFLGGDDVIAAAGGVMGFDSFVSPLLNMLPQVTRDTLYAVDQCCLSPPRRSVELQRYLTTTFYDVGSKGGFKRGMKVALEYYSGIKMGPPALPAKPMPKKMREYLKGVYTNISIC